MTLEEELNVARSAARRGGQAALLHWRRGTGVETKSDDSPVTAADRESEQVIAAALGEAFPADGQLGEEGAARENRSGRRWLIDPVDGTRDFVRGGRTWSVQLALEEGQNNVIAGVVHFPALDETYYAGRGGGAWLNGERIRVSSITDLARAVLCVNDLDELNRFPFGARFIEWVAGFWAVRNPGGSPDAMMVAAGRAEAWIEPRAKAWDLAPHKIITEEAGGVFRNFDGGASISAGNCITCNPWMEERILEFVQSA